VPYYTKYSDTFFASIEVCVESIAIGLAALVQNDEEHCVAEQVAAALRKS